jgi:hypothetical protein
MNFKLLIFVFILLYYNAGCRNDQFIKNNLYNMYRLQEGYLVDTFFYNNGESFIVISLVDSVYKRIRLENNFIPYDSIKPLIKGRVHCEYMPVSNILLYHCYIYNSRYAYAISAIDTVTYKMSIWHFYGD